MKNLLIISPHFPPSNTADMQRVRQCLPYFAENGWRAVVVAVKHEYTEAPIDELLLKTIPQNIEILRINALPTHKTRKFGLGNLGIRSLPFYNKIMKELVKKYPFDLVYFSTTMFPVMALGRWWKFWYKIPYIIDMQDPWRSDHYLKLPPAERPPKFEFAYRLEKILEAFTMKKVDGIVSVSQSYCDTLIKRYKNVTQAKCEVITFGLQQTDAEIVATNEIINPFFNTDSGYLNMVYVGRGGGDLKKALSYIFSGICKGLENEPNKFKKLKLFFIGTSYALAGTGVKTIEPLAEEYGIGDRVREITDRIGYFQALKVLSEAHILLIQGSDDAAYSASKIYPYLLANKPLLCVFHKNSNVVDFISKTNAGMCITFDENSTVEQKATELHTELSQLIDKLPFIPQINDAELKPYKASELTKRQTQFFDKICAKSNKTKS